MSLSQLYDRTTCGWTHTFLVPRWVNRKPMGICERLREQPAQTLMAWQQRWNGKDLLNSTDQDTDSG